MQTSIEFFGDPETPLTQGQTIVARHRAVMVNVLGALMEALFVDSASLDVQTPVMFPVYRLTLEPTAGVEPPQEIIDLRAGHGGNIIKDIMIAIGAKSMRLMYTEDRLGQLRDYAESLRTGAPSNSRFNAIPIPDITDPDIPSDTNPLGDVRWTPRG